MKCKKCKSEMKELLQSFDLFSSFLNQVQPMYCTNEECERFGDVTVAGFREYPPLKDKK